MERFRLTAQDAIWGPGFRHEVPRNCQNLLTKGEFLECALLRRQKLNKKLEDKSNSWKRNRLGGEIRKAGWEI